MPELSFDVRVLRRGTMDVLRGVRGEAHGGRIHAILGPNGVGKSSLLRVLAGLDSADAKVLLDGQDLASCTSAERARHVAWVPQSPAVPSDVTVAHVVALARAGRGERSSVVREHVATALDRCGAAALASRLFAELSAGQRQRVVIARALATGAKVLLLDEPFSALDLQASLELDALLRTVAASGAIVVAVLHDLAHAARLADHAFVLHAGTLHASAAPREALSADVLATVWGVRPERDDLSSFALVGAP